MDTLAATLDSIFHLESRFPHASSTLFLVDNGRSTGLTKATFSSLQPKFLKANCEFKVLQGHGNVGYGRGQNLAFEMQHAHYHLFMNPDVNMGLDTLSNGLVYLESNNDVGMVSPSATGKRGDKQFLCKRYPAVLDFLIRGLIPSWGQSFFARRLHYYEMRDLTELRPTKDIPIVSGCFMLCRSDVIRQVSGFDPSYFLYFEDFDLSMRVHAVADIAYLPSMRIQHTGGHAARKGFNHIRYFLRSAWRFFKIYKWRWF